MTDYALQTLDAVAMIRYYSYVIGQFFRNFFYDRCDSITVSAWYFHFIRDR